MTALFVYTALLLPAHLLLAARSRDRRARVRWLVASLAGLGAASPVIVLSLTESRQVSWLERPSARTIVDVLGSQFTTKSTMFVGGLAWVAAAIGLVVLWRRSERLTAAALAWWLLGPTAVLVAVSFIHPSYTPRYVTFCAPAMALLAGVAIAAIRWPALRVVAIAATLALVFPAWLTQRAPDAKEDSPRWDAIARAVEEYRGPPGDLDESADAVIYGPLPDRPHWSARIIAIAYPTEFAGLSDLTIGRSGAASGRLWDSDVPIASRLDRLAEAQRVFVVHASDGEWGAGLPGQLASRRFVPSEHTNAGGATISLYVRK